MKPVIYHGGGAYNNGWDLINGEQNNDSSSLVHSGGGAPVPGAWLPEIDSVLSVGGSAPIPQGWQADKTESSSLGYALAETCSPLNCETVLGFTRRWVASKALVTGSGKVRRASFFVHNEYSGSVAGYARARIAVYKAYQEQNEKIGDTGIWMRSAGAVDDTAFYKHYWQTFTFSTPFNVSAGDNIFLMFWGDGIDLPGTVSFSNYSSNSGNYHSAQNSSTDIIPPYNWNIVFPIQMTTNVVPLKIWGELE